MSECIIPGCDRSADIGDRCDHHQADLDPSQESLFDRDELAPWADHWKGMPEFVQNDLAAFKSVIVHFANSSDLSTFAKLVGQTVTLRTQSLWFPEAEIWTMTDKRFADETEAAEATNGQWALDV